MKHSMSPPARSHGFTLVELLVAMVILAILAAIAYPSYTGQVARTNRKAAQACLSEYAQFMERYYTTNLTYEDAAPNLGCSTEGKLDQHYTFAVGNLGGSTFTVTATPKGVQQSRDAKCGTLSVRQDGTRTASGAAGAAGCW